MIFANEEVLGQLLQGLRFGLRAFKLNSL